MAEAGSSIFNRKATDKLRSPDDLDKYVQVTNPSIWVVLGACFALLVGLLAWGVFGTVSTSVSVTGTVIEGRAVCLLSAENTAKVHKGDAANVGGERMNVDSIGVVPVSRSEASDYLKSDYLVSSLMQGDWAYMIVFAGDTADLTEHVPVSVSITTESVAPISLIIGKQG